MKLSFSFCILILLPLISCTNTKDSDVIENIQPQIINTESVPDEKSTEEVVKIEEIEIITYEINAPNVRFRMHPVLEDNIIRNFSKGEKVEVISRTFYKEIIQNMINYWFKVKSGEEIGWVYGDFISIDMDTINALENENVSSQYLKEITNHSASYISKFKDDSIPFEFVNDSSFYMKAGDSFESVEYKDDFKQYKFINEAVYYNTNPYNINQYIQVSNNTDLYVSKSEILLFPFVITIDKNKNPDDDKFFHLTEEPADQEQQDLLTKMSNYYHVHQTEIIDHEMFLNINTYNDINPAGWTDKNHVTIDVHFSKKEQLMDNLFLFDVPKEVPKIIETYGQPESFLVNETKNRHSDTIDNIYFLQYNGLRIRVYHATEIDKYIILEISIQNNNYPVNKHFYIGQEIDFVINVLGEPSDITKNVYRFDFYSEFMDVGYIYFETDDADNVIEIGTTHYTS